ncbi:hypothetical protein [Paraburkholderia sp. C35]|uniref:hypothetical protein n=1 Tax=Paraburkholderia sp. C35 TaxID=2126993 RepID=UPI000D692E59|nr:hypothetical protein [Paraburkholderia sp. C35]
MTNRPRKTLQSPAPTLPMLLRELEASLPSLMAQPASFSTALARVCRGLSAASAPMRQRKPRAARPARSEATDKPAKKVARKASGADMPMSLPLVP